MVDDAVCRVLWQFYSDVRVLLAFTLLERRAIVHEENRAILLRQ